MSLWAWFGISLLGFVVFAALALMGIGAGSPERADRPTKGKTR